MANWQQGELIELEITDLNDDGDGVGRAKGRVVFVPDTVPGDVIEARLVFVKSKYGHAILKKILKPSTHRVRPSCIVADKCGGCTWQHIDYQYQLEAKRNQVVQALARIGGFVAPDVDAVLHTGSGLAYRNKATYPVGTSATGNFVAGYYQKNSHQIVNINQCPVQDERLNALLHKVKLDIQAHGWRPYDEKLHTGLIRHISLRIGRRTGEVTITLVINQSAVNQVDIPGIEAVAQEWLDSTPPLVGVMLNLNGERTNAVFGRETRLVAGRNFLREEFSELEFQVRPDTFFQVYTETAEALVQQIKMELGLKGEETLFDAYCGIGTLTLPLAKHVGQAIGIEVQPEAVEQARSNAQHNGIDNVKFYAGTVEKLILSMDVKPDIVVLDPPRKGCATSVIEALLNLKPKRIVYVSCKVATLARDLKLLCQDGEYTLTRVTPADFFPQTAHVETAAYLVLSQLASGNEEFSTNENSNL